MPNHYLTKISYGFRYRVMLARANGKAGLILMTPRLAEARNATRQFIDRHLKALQNSYSQIVGDPDRPRFIYLEVWKGSPTTGGWVSLSKPEGGIRFEFFDRRPKPRKTSETDADSNPKTLKGEILDCKLESEKTKRGGWKAKLVDKNLSGPITNWEEVDRSLVPGDRLKLKVESISNDWTRIQFRWVGNLN